MHACLQTQAMKNRQLILSTCVCCYRTLRMDDRALQKALLVAATNILAALSWTPYAPLWKWAGFCIFFSYQADNLVYKTRSFIHNCIQEWSTEQEEQQESTIYTKNIHICVCVFERVYLLHDGWTFPYTFWKTQAHLSVVAHQSSEAEALCFGAIMKKKRCYVLKASFNTGGSQGQPGLISHLTCSSGRGGVSREIPLSVMVTFLMNCCMHANLFPGQCAAAAQCSVDAFTVRKMKRKRGRNILEEHTRRKIQLWTGIAFYFNLYIQNICKYFYTLFSE